MKKKEIKVNEFDAWYEEERFEYGKAIKDLKELYCRMEGAYKLHQMTGMDKWEQHEHEAYMAFKTNYNIICDWYGRLEKYYNEHHEQMEKCKTWNETLWHPDEWLIRWTGGLK